MLKENLTEREQRGYVQEFRIDIFQHIKHTSPLPSVEPIPLTTICIYL